MRSRRESITLLLIVCISTLGFWFSSPNNIDFLAADDFKGEKDEEDEEDDEGERAMVFVFSLSFSQSLPTIDSREAKTVFAISQAYFLCETPPQPARAMKCLSCVKNEGR